MSSETKGHDEQVEELRGHLRKLSNRMVLFQQNAANSMGIIHTDWKTADILNETGPITAGELARITGLSTGSVTALIDRLEQAGFVKREKDPEDRRRVIIVPLMKGRTELRELYMPIVERTMAICKPYSAEQMELLIGFVDQLVEMFHTESQRFGMPESQE